MTNELLARIDLLTEQLEDYKSRCEKGIEYINKKDEWVKNSEYRLLKTEDLLNILQNGDNKDD